MDGYIRVSRRMGRGGPGYISPDVQREAIQRWADYKGVELAAWHVDEDQSGGTHDRPGLVAAIERAAQGETGGIVSWKIDRFSRYTEGGLRDLERLESAGARLAFVTEDIDTSGPMGKFVYTIMLAMGAYFLDTIKAGWITSKSRAMSRGVKIGPTPFGYARVKSGPLVPHTEQAPIAREAFKRAARDGLTAAYDYLNANAAGTAPDPSDERTATGLSRLQDRPGRTWTVERVRRFLRNRTYLGESRYGEMVKVDAHEPLTTRGTWEAAQPSDAAPRRPSATYPLSGLAVCGSCGGPMVGHRAGANLRSYRCSASSNGGDCADPATTVADRLETLVIGTVRDALTDEPGFAVGEVDGTALADAEEVLRTAEGELARFAADGQAYSLLGDGYHAAMESRATAVDEAQATYRTLAASTATARVIPTIEAWDAQTPAELAQGLRAALESVIVQRGRGPIDGRVRIVAHGSDELAGVPAA